MTAEDTEDAEEVVYINKNLRVLRVLCGENSYSKDFLTDFRPFSTKANRQRSSVNARRARTPVSG